MRLLKLGPGAAPVAHLAARPDLAWVGLERSLDCLGAMSGSLTGGAIVDVESLQRLPAGFDVVLAADTLEHLNDPEGMLQKIHGALRPGGRLLVSVPNVANLYVRMRLLFGQFPYAERGILDRDHRVFFTWKLLREMLEGEGFRIERRGVSSIPLPLALPRLPGWLLALLGATLEAATRLLPKLLGYQLLVVASRLAADNETAPGA